MLLRQIRHFLRHLISPTMFYRGRCTLAILEHLQTLECMMFYCFQASVLFLEILFFKMQFSNYSGKSSLSSSSIFSVSSIRSSARCPVHFKTICKWYRDQNYWWENYFFPLQRGTVSEVGKRKEDMKNVKFYAWIFLDDLTITSDKNWKKVNIQLRVYNCLWVNNNKLFASK